MSNWQAVRRREQTDPTLLLQRKREEIGSASIVGPVGYELRSGSGVGAGG